MPAFTTETTTPATPDETFDLICDLSRWPLFRGYGPVPGIVEATLPEGGAVGLGSRIRVCNTDRSIHHEVVTAFERGRRFAVRMELTPPASLVLRPIEETVDLAPLPGGGGTRMLRRFAVRPRSIFTAPLAWLVGGVLLPRAVKAHDAALAAALGGAGGRGR